MKVTHTGPHAYQLEAETSEDSVFLQDIGINRTARVTNTRSGLVLPGSATVTTKPDSTADLLQALIKLNNLFRAQPHGQSHVGTDAADPHAQERATAIIKKLNLVLDALGAPVSDDQAAQVVTKPHKSSNGQSAIVNPRDQLKTASDYRRDWLEFLIHEHGSIAALNVALGRAKTDATLSQIRNKSAHSRTDAPRNMGDSIAREIELKLNLGHASLDNPLPQGACLKEVQS